MRLVITENTILRSIFLLNTLLSQAIIFNSKDTLQDRQLTLSVSCVLYAKIKATNPTSPDMFFVV